MAKWVSATHIYMHKTGSKNLQSCLKQRWQCQCGVARADHDQEEHDAAGEVDGSEGGGREVGGWEGGRWLVRTSIKLSAGGGWYCSNLPTLPPPTHCTLFFRLLHTSQQYSNFQPTCCGNVWKARWSFGGWWNSCECWEAGSGRNSLICSQVTPPNADYQCTTDIFVQCTIYVLQCTICTIYVQQCTICSRCTIYVQHPQVTPPNADYQCTTYTYLYNMLPSHCFRWSDYQCTEYVQYAKLYFCCHRVIRQQKYSRKLKGCCSLDQLETRYSFFIVTLQAYDSGHPNW